VCSCTQAGSGRVAAAAAAAVLFTHTHLQPQGPELFSSSFCHGGYNILLCYYVIAAGSSSGVYAASIHAV
jgi:hypothetical protein